MKRLWQDYDGAIAALAEDKREKLACGEAMEYQAQNGGHRA